jgi:plasmid maintenance system antidote protein VapI
MFWFNLQDAYDLSRAKAECGAELERIEPVSGSPAT